MSMYKINMYKYHFSNKILIAYQFYVVISCLYLHDFKFLADQIPSLVLGMWTSPVCNGTLKRIGPFNKWVLEMLAHVRTT